MPSNQTLQQHIFNLLDFDINVQSRNDLVKQIESIDQFSTDSYLDFANKIEEGLSHWKEDFARNLEQQNFSPEEQASLFMFFEETVNKSAIEAIKDLRSAAKDLQQQSLDSALDLEETQEITTKGSNLESSSILEKKPKKEKQEVAKKDFKTDILSDEIKKPLSKIENFSCTMLSCGIKVLEGVIGFKNALDSIHPNLSDIVIKSGAGLLVGAISTICPAIVVLTYQVNIPDNISNFLKNENLEKIKDKFSKTLDSIQKGVSKEAMLSEILGTTKEVIEKMGIKNDVLNEFLDAVKDPKTLEFAQKIFTCAKEIPSSAKELNDKIDSIMSDIEKTGVDLSKNQKTQIIATMQKHLEPILLPENLDKPLFSKFDTIVQATQNMGKDIDKIITSNKETAKDVRKAIDESMLGNIVKIGPITSSAEKDVAAKLGSGFASNVSITKAAAILSQNNGLSK